MGECSIQGEESSPPPMGPALRMANWVERSNTEGEMDAKCAISSSMSWSRTSATFCLSSLTLALALGPGLSSELGRGISSGVNQAMGSVSPMGMTSRSAQSWLAYQAPRVLESREEGGEGGVLTIMH